MKNFKRLFAFVLVFGMIASLVACDMESLMSDLLEDPELEDEIADVLENKTSKEEDSEEEITDDEKEETTTKRKWPSWFGGGEEDSVTIETQTIINEGYSEDIWYPVEEEWPDEPVGELEYTLEYNDMGEEYYVLSNIGSWRGKCLYVPSEYEGIPVKKIGYSAFMGANGLELVEVAEGVEEIDMWAFGHCEKLSEVYLPSTLTYISERVFTYSANIGNIAINPGDECRYYSLNNGCIIDANTKTLHTLVNNCTWFLQELLECYDIRAIGPDACRGLTNLEHIKIPDNIEEIGHYAFYGCSNLTHVDFGNTENSKLSYIGSSAFAYCSSIKGMYMPMGNPTYYAMGDCLIERNTGRIVLGCAYSNIPDDGSVTIIGGFAFEGNSNLRKIEIPASVKVIEIAAFEGCSNLRGVKLHEGLETIEQRAFCHDNQLKDITIPSTVTHIGDEAFRGVPGFDDSYTEPEYDGNGDIYIKPDGSFDSSYDEVISGGSFGGIIGAGDIKVNPDGSITVTFPDGTTSTFMPDEDNKIDFGGSYEDVEDGNFGFTTIVGGNGNLIYKPVN